MKQKSLHSELVYIQNVTYDSYVVIFTQTTMFS